MKIKSLMIIAILLFSGIYAVDSDKSISNKEVDIVGMPNPASVYCIEQGGTLEMQKDSTGGEYGLCYFNEKTVESVCEEWAFYRGECKKGQIKKKIDGGIPPYSYDGLENATVECIWEENKTCIEIYAPVCGVDGKTYSNSCHAESKCVKIAHEGECEKSITDSDSVIRCIGGKEGERCGVSDSAESIMIKVSDNVMEIGNEIISYDDGEKPIVSVDVESAEAGMQSIEIKPSVIGHGTLTSYDENEKPINAEFTNDLKIQENSLILVDEQSKEYKIEVLPSEVYGKIAPTVSTKITGMKLQVEDSQAVYNVKAEKQAKVLGFIDANAEVEYIANAGTGEIKMKSAPWWGFFAGNAFEIQ